ncbi:hypothetical protein V1226_20440 [Lachnospiraceae bacterium JLR.KK009]|nr:hypothetical protein C810_04202 [Lachnospiraceae bacterium A2]MCI8882511.1 hypothetical protein [Lachnospiraceae bacterium]
MRKFSIGKFHLNFIVNIWNFLRGADIDIEAKAKVIYESDTDDIISQN